MIECGQLKCCGCSACVQICPQRCIYMHEDSEGFLYPHIDKSLCIDCHLCEKVCPFLNVYERRSPFIIYAAKSKDEGLRLHSSSGGIFSLLAEAVIKEGGVVFGAHFDANWEVKHGYTETIEGLVSFRGSKYVQSCIGDSYRDVQVFLKKGRKVLFTGTPCQVAGLKHYLHREYDNLLVVDFICHGVPSPKIWRTYLDEIIIDQGNKRKMISSHSPSLKDAITKIDFRSKLLGWRKFSLTIASSVEGDNGAKDIVLLSSIFMKNSYMQAFLSNLILRPSCYHCMCKNGVNHSDITLADFWGVDSRIPDFDDDKGVSIVIISSERGKNYYDGLDVDSRLINLEDAKVKNDGFKEHILIPRNRGLFFFLVNKKGMSIDKATKRCLEGTILRRILRQMKRLVLEKIDSLYK